MSGPPVSDRVCEGCREWLEPDEPDVIRAAPLVNVTGFSAAGMREYADGIPVWFHRTCFPFGSTRYRQLEQ